MVKIGVLGAGGMGNVHTRHWRLMPDVEVRFFDRDPGRQQEFASRHQVTCCGSAEELIAWCDALDICLPTDLHLPFALQALNAGKHVLCEKPVVGSLQDAEALLGAVTKSGMTLMPAQVVRHFADYRKAHQLVKSGAAGVPQTARTRRGGKAPAGLGGWFQDFERSGGVLLDLAVHDFDWLRWTLGEVRNVTSRSVRVGQNATLGERPGDYALTTLEFESGAVAHVEATWLDPSGFRTTLEVCGDKGMIELDSRKVAAVRRHQESGSQQENPLSGDDDPYYRQGRAFLAAIQGGPQEITALDGVMAVSIALAAIESAKSGKRVSPARHF